MSARIVICLGLLIAWGCTAPSGSNAASSGTLRSAHAATAGSERPGGWLLLRVLVEHVPRESLVGVLLRIECPPRPGILEQRVAVGRRGEQPEMAQVSVEVPRCPESGPPQVEIVLTPPGTRCVPATATAAPEGGQLVARAALQCIDVDLAPSEPEPPTQ